MVRGFTLYNEGQQKYQLGRLPEAFELYRQAVLQILKNEDVLQKVNVPEQHPQEVLAIVWQNLLACFKSNDGAFTQETHPEAYDLVYSFRPASSAKAHPQFKGPQGRRLLKAMQISAAFALGILAWGKGDRATAAKRYQEALDIAATHPPFNAVTPGLKHLDRTIAHDVQEMRDNLAMLIQNDRVTAGIVGSGQGVLRKEVLDAPLTRVGDNAITQDKTYVVATDACGRVGCSKRGVGFKRCSACKKTAYCSVECQKEDWKKHKLTH
ncbi:hypothetical protein MVEN_01351900 [Mycena venus]|uniref:MYND-type domain-containing protein n=1 Tax=Mycena venus TaxID=2733690 RepID=A0A8H6Y1Y4_9AGAR|nr:hypothetical protein MVEN_01351900 [Mycena venus]